MLRFQETSLQGMERIALDTETTGLDWPRDEMFGFSITTPIGSGYWDIRRTPRALDWLRDEMARFDGLTIFFNASFDLKMLYSQDVVIDPATTDDTAVRACIIDENRATPYPWRKGGTHLAYSLDALAKDCLGEGKVGDIYVELAQIFGGNPTRNVQAPNFHRAPVEVMRPYAIRDTILTYRLWEWQEERIQNPDRYGMDLSKVADFERSVFPHVLDQEINGIRVDTERAEIARTELHIKIKQDQARLSEIAGIEKVNSPLQVRNHFQPREVADGKWVLGNGYPCDTTAKGNPSINSDVLHGLVADHNDPVAELIISIRSDIRTADTFLGKHVLEHAFNGRVYPNINQVASEQGGTKTGRFSYTNPAMQQIPNRNKATAAIVKPVFLPDEGQVWLDGDMASFEVRTFAHLVAKFNQALQLAYEQNPEIDFHDWVADLMGVPRNPQPEGGGNAKQLNLSMIFNSGKGAIANKLKLPVTSDSFEDEYGDTIHFYRSGVEGEKIIDKYHRTVRGVRELAEACKKKAESRGYLFTLFGRKLRFPRKYKSYKASGILIQATAADVNKDNWRIIADCLGDRGRMMLNTHDSYSMSVDEDKHEQAWADVKAGIERPILRVPLILDLNGVGSNWWDAIRKDK